MPQHKGKRETAKLMDFVIGFTTGDAVKQVKSVTRRGSQSRAILMTMAYLSNSATPEQKADAKKEIGYSLVKQTGRILSKKVQEATEHAY